MCIRDSDYAFQVSKEDTFQSKTMKIFDEKDGLSQFMVLRPSIFHKDCPIGLYKSTHPGFLTENGCLIFHYDADKPQYLEELDLTKKKIWEQLWPGQLVAVSYTHLDVYKRQGTSNLSPNEVIE